MIFLFTKYAIYAVSNTVRGKYLEGENIGEFGEFMVSRQIFILQMS